MVDSIDLPEFTAFAQRLSERLAKLPKPEKKTRKTVKSI